MVSRRDAWTLWSLGLAAVVLLALQWAWTRPEVPVVDRPALPAPSVRVDLNRASAAELEALPEIGPRLAGELVRRRPFRSLDELAKIPGLGPRGLERLSTRVTLGSP